MNHLLKYYTSRIIALAVTIVLTALFMDNIVVPYCASKFGAGHWSVYFLVMLTSRPSILVLLVAGEFIVRKYLWKIKILGYPELDFSGEWEGETTYKVTHIGNSIVPFSIHHKVKITQDCLSIRISPSNAQQVVNWGSLALELAEGDTLRYAYWVNYDDSRLPKEAKGYEEMKVTNRDKKNRPIEMTGKFFQCAQGMTPVYSGDVIWHYITTPSP